MKLASKPGRRSITSGKHTTALLWRARTATSTSATPGRASTAASTSATPGRASTAASISATPGRANTATSTSATPGRANTATSTSATPGRASTSTSISATPGRADTATSTLATPGRASTSTSISATPGRASTAASTSATPERPSTSISLPEDSTAVSVETTASTGRATTPRSRPEKKRWNFNPRLDAKERPAHTPKKSSERFQSISRPNVSKQVVKTVKSSTKTSGETVKTTRPKTIRRKGSDKLIVTYVDGVPVVLVESGPNKGKVIPIPPIPRRPPTGRNSYRPPTSFKSRPGTNASADSSVPGPSVDSKDGLSFKVESSDRNLDVAGGSKEKPPSPKQTQLSLKTEAAIARIEETKKWEAFFKDQSVEALLACCEYAGAADLGRIHTALRHKLGMNDEKPWAQISLPRNFVALLNEMTTRTHTETNDEARIAMFRILLDLADRYDPDGLVTFHNDVGLVLCLDQRLHSYRQYDNGELPKNIQDEYRVILQIKAWFCRTYERMMDSWIPRTPRPESSMNRTSLDTKYAIDRLFSLDNIFPPSDIFASEDEDESDED